MDPRSEFELIGGRPLRDLPAERAARRDRRSGFREWLASHPAVIWHPPLADWFEQAMRQGRVHEGMRDFVE